MMRSLYSGVAGLKTHQTKMDVIGNNIANVNTTSYKSQSITFSDLMYQTTQTASGATETKGGINPRQIGLGTKSGAINTAITSQGTTQTTNNPFDIMITGKSFFVVNNGVENLYTRDGSFYVDGAGNLAMQSNGYLVQGWAAKEDRETGEITVNRNGGLSSLQIMSPANFTYAPASTTAAVFQGNIDDNDSNVNSADGKTITLEFYDNKGYLYTGKFTLKNTDDPDLFALSLTDIIDSNGKTINDNKDKVDLMSQITFGNVSGNSRTIKNDALRGFSIEATTDSNFINIIKSDGDVKYPSVSATGNLIDLYNNGLLESAYGLSRTSLENRYTKEGFANATYQIGANGVLSVTYPTVDVAEGIYSGDFDNNKIDFTTPNSDNYFINEQTQEAYKVPDENLKDNVQRISGLLKDVFGKTDLSSYSGFKYAGGNLSLYEKFTYLKDETVLTESFEDKGKVSPNLVSRDFGQFAGLTDAVTDYINGGGSYDKLKYTYKSDGTLTITQSVNVDKEKEIDTQNTQFGELDEDKKTAFKNAIENMLAKFDGANYSFGSQYSSEIGYKVIEEIAGSTADSANEEGRTFTQDQIDAAKAIKSVIDTQYDAIDTNDKAKAKPDSFKLVDISGDGGLIVKYTSAETKDGNFPNADSNRNTNYKRNAKEVLSANDYKNGYTINGSAPAYVFKNRDDYGKSYYVANDLLSRAFKGNNQDVIDFIKNVFPDDTQNMTFDSNAEYKMSISQKGELTLSHDVKDSTNFPVQTAATGFKAERNDDGTYKYTSTSAYKNVPVKGKISDLLSVSEDSPQKELLSKVYGISDEAADAYGLDGTYEIITAEGTDKGKINLTIGNRTIQIAFDPATGAIVSADGNSLDKKANITFGLNGQATAGLEAFGFQASPTNAAELERNHTISVDFSTLSNYNTSKSSTITASKGDMKSLNTGRAVGEMNGVNVSDNGMIYANYSNGQTKLLGQIASAEFANASGLSKQGDNLYASTLNSGDATIQDITTDGGYMSTGVLEMSNVDLSAQFTEMITTQRGFQANSRIITVSDTLLEELTNLKR
ncbi:flagellar hook-basal body complex protein [Butyrivibrio hungatei]|uniref:flagellar hook-basal body complex protein n=1 Tax=Butyrivibrio hungatei TaxID=185008 RepID=UPI00040BDA7B|nr:flagellar hook-basal body complex protein [Butyrivibrio hungatei]